jgi:hypothetical protein
LNTRGQRGYRKGVALPEIRFARNLQKCSITAIVENDTIKLPMHVPDGTSVEVTLPAEAVPTDRRKWLDELARRRARGITRRAGTPLQAILDDLRREEPK